MSAATAAEPSVMQGQVRHGIPGSGFKGAPLGRGGPSPAFSRKERGSEGVSPTSGDISPEPQPDQAHRGKKSIAGCLTARQAA